MATMMNAVMARKRTCSIHYIVSILLTTLMMMTVMTGQAAGEHRYDTHGDEVPLAAKEAEGVIYRLDSSDSGSKNIVLVINEDFFSIDSHTIFRTNSGALTDISHFQPGMYVKIYFIGSLLTNIREDQSQGGTKDTSSSANSPSPKGSKTNKTEKLRQENGVWKN